MFLAMIMFIQPQYTFYICFHRQQLPHLIARFPVLRERLFLFLKQPSIFILKPLDRRQLLQSELIKRVLRSLMPKNVTFMLRIPFMPSLAPVLLESFCTPWFEAEGCICDIA